MLKTFTLIQGDSYFLRFPLLKEGQAWPVAGWSFWWTLKLAEDDTDAAAVAQKSTEQGTILPFPGSSTEVYVVGAPSDTKGKSVGRYVWDFQGKSPEDDIVTLERGYVLLKAEATRAV